MAQDITKVHIGASRIWIPTTPPGTQPVTGAPPTLCAHTSGVPSSPQTGFNEVGHTEGPAVFEYTIGNEDIRSEQSMGILHSFPITQDCTLTFTAQERTLETLKAAFDAIGLLDDGSKTLFYAGGSYSVRSQVVILTSQQMFNTAKYEVLCIYKGQNVNGVRLEYSRTKASTYQVVLRGVHDAARTVGDQLFQWFREK